MPRGSCESCSPPSPPRKPVSPAPLSTVTDSVPCMDAELSITVGGRRKQDSGFTNYNQYCLFVWHHIYIFFSRRLRCPILSYCKWLTCGHIVYIQLWVLYTDGLFLHQETTYKSHLTLTVISVYYEVSSIEAGAAGCLGPDPAWLFSIGLFISCEWQLLYKELTWLQLYNKNHKVPAAVEVYHHLPPHTSYYASCLTEKVDFMYHRQL